MRRRAEVTAETSWATAKQSARHRTRSSTFSCNRRACRFCKWTCMHGQRAYTPAAVNIPFSALPQPRATDRLESLFGRDETNAPSLWCKAVQDLLASQWTLYPARERAIVAIFPRRQTTELTGGCD